MNFGEAECEVMKRRREEEENEKRIGKLGEKQGKGRKEQMVIKSRNRG